MPSNLIREIERKRRVLGRIGHQRPIPRDLLTHFTAASFQLEQLAITDRDITEAMAPRRDHRIFRRPQSLRVRNHVAILRSIEKAVRHGDELQPTAVLRWYTSISCGLSSATMDRGRMVRLERLLSRANSPKLQLQLAIWDIASLHVEMLADPVFPGFNGILARLLMQFHLARCRLPPVVLQSHADAASTSSARQFAPRLLQLVVQSYDLLLARF